jgi:TPR repeat protein
MVQYFSWSLISHEGQRQCRSFKEMWRYSTFADLPTHSRPVSQSTLSSSREHIRQTGMKKLIAQFVLLLVVLLAAPTYAQDYDSGLAAYRRGDHAAALEAWRAAAVQGDVKAQSDLGGMYDAGIGVPQNSGEAVKWYRLAAEQGLALAQLNLAHMYREGLGVPQDYGEAVQWYRLAAEHGFALAQSNLGWMYLNGLGVEQNDSIAARWYQRAAEQGDARAQNNLGILYATGRGLPHNDMQAYVWFKLAAAQGYSDAARNLKLSAANLSPDQLREANLIAKKM